MSSLADRVDFGRIRYANCWEDARVLLAALPDTAQNVLCIASAGDNALALLTRPGVSVQAVDLSRPQLFLTELRRQCFAELSYESMLRLLGVRECPPQRRIELLGKLRLSPEASAYWAQHAAVVAGGIVHAGKFERYFSAFRRYLLPLVHSRKTIARLIAPKSEKEQLDFYRECWDSWRWRLLMRVFFSRFVLGKWGRDPQFLQHVKISVPDYIRQRTESYAASAGAIHNPFLHYIFSGNYSEEALPIYLQPQHFETIRNNIHKLSIVQMSAEEAVKGLGFDTLCLSNIFEYMSENEHRRLALGWAEALPAGTRLLYWNLMAPRSLAAVLPDSYRSLDADAAAASADDFGFFYSRFLIEEKR